MSKSLCKNRSFYNKFQNVVSKCRFRISYAVLLCQKYFWSTIFWQWNDNPFKIFGNLHENAFCFFIFLNERNILMIQLKCTVVHYVNLRSSSIIFKLRAVEYASPFFSICYLSLFQRGSCEKLFKKIFIFNTHFQNSSQDVGYYRILGCQTLWY